MPKGERGIYGKNVDARQAQAKSVEARKRNKNRIAAFLSTIKTEPVTEREADEMDRHFLQMTSEELRAYAEDNRNPADLRVRARQWLHKNDKDGLMMGEMIRNRSFGKPVQRNQHDIRTDRPIEIIDFTKPRKK